MAAITVTVGKVNGKLSLIGEPCEDPTAARAAFKELIQGGGKIGDVQYDSAELIDSRCGRMKRAQFVRGNGEVKSQESDPGAEETPKPKKPKKVKEPKEPADPVEE